MLLALVGAREAFGSVSGGGLSPAPAAASRLVAAAPRVAGTRSGWAPRSPRRRTCCRWPLLATLLGGSPTAAVTALLVLAVPVALWGAWRFLRVVGRLVAPAGAPRWLVLWGATTYALVPVVSGAWGDGRFGTVAVAALLPWLAHAALGFADPDADRRWRAAWRCALLLALAAAFVPAVWFLAALLGLVVVAAAFGLVPGAVRDRSVWGPPATALAMVPVLLSPWWIPAAARGRERGTGPRGRPPALPPGSTPSTCSPAGSATWARRVAGRRGRRCSPSLALAPRPTRVPVLVCWIVALVAAVAAAALGSFTLSLRRGHHPARAGRSSWSSCRARSSSPRCSGPRGSRGGSRTPAGRGGARSGSRSRPWRSSSRSAVSAGSSSAAPTASTRAATPGSRRTWSRAR